MAKREPRADVLDGGYEEVILVRHVPDAETAIELARGEYEETYDEPATWPLIAREVVIRVFPWCHCGEGHAWHYEPAKPGTRGAFRAFEVVPERRPA